MVTKIIDKIEKDEGNKAVIECLRNPAEIQVFRKKFAEDFFLIAIDAEPETRWERVKDIYGAKKELFERDDERDSGHRQAEYGQQVKKCIDEADILINNNESFFTKDGGKDNTAIDKYGQKISDYLKLMQGAGVRPPYPDELYMQQAFVVACSSECSKRQVGAVITKGVEHKEEKKFYSYYVLSTGCNNVPTGEKSCRRIYPKANGEGGCYRDTAKKDYFQTYKYCRKCGEKLPENNLTCSKCGMDNKKLPSKLLDICRAVHAEESAIIQTARLGSTSLNDTRLYTSTFPCMLCCKKIIASGIKSVIYFESYPMEESLAVSMFRTCNIEIRKYEGVSSKAYFRVFKRDL